MEAALALLLEERLLKRVDFPTFGSPTMPTLRPMRPLR